MISWFPSTVAGFAVRRPNCLVIEISLGPICCIMASRTLAPVMVVWLFTAVAGFTICCSDHLVIEICLPPIVVVMAG
jgi:hypothetical protein